MGRFRLEEYIAVREKEAGFSTLVVTAKDDFVDIVVMALPEALRGQKIGSRFMRDICCEADRQKAAIALYPEPGFPGWTDADKDRLIRLV